MKTFIWTLIGFAIVGSIAKVMLIGQPRDPITNGEAAWSIAVNAVIILGYIHWFL